MYILKQGAGFSVEGNINSVGDTFAVRLDHFKQVFLFCFFFFLKLPNLITKLSLLFGAQVMGRIAENSCANPWDGEQLGVPWTCVLTTMC